MVELYASSSAADTDFFVRLIDVHPDGLARDVSLGMVRARYRNGLDQPERIEPDEVVKYSITMNPTSNAFLPGHRIRLDITSSDFPNYDRNHNTAADQNADPVLETAPSRSTMARTVALGSCSPGSAIQNKRKRGRASEAAHWPARTCPPRLGLGKE